MEEKVTFSIKVTVKDMYFFLLRHLFTGFGGWFGILFAVALILVAIFTRGNVPVEYTVLYGVVAVFVLVYPFFNMHGKAKRQVNSDSLNRPLKYEAGEDGIAVVRDEERGEIGWQDLKKVIETKKHILVYLNTIRAFVWPKEQIGSQYDLLVKLLNEKLEPSQNRLKKGRK